MRCGGVFQRHARRRLRLFPPGRDSGVTLAEMMVSMTILLVVLTMFTTGIVQIYRAVNKTESMSIAQSEINNLFLRLDKEIRYASGISLPAQVGADWYVEFETTHSVPAKCTELRLTAGSAKLEHRAWAQGTPPPVTWTPLASGISAAPASTPPASTPPATVAPFFLVEAGTTGNFDFHRLTLALVVTSGRDTTATSAATSVTFTAVNTSRSTRSETVCSEGRP
jgi:prepilin-type N-terminal cleavage/methylation domain-containing protein